MQNKYKCKARKLNRVIYLGKKSNKVAITALWNDVHLKRNKHIQPNQKPEEHATVYNYCNK